MFGSRATEGRPLRVDFGRMREKLVQRQRGVTTSNPVATGHAGHVMGQRTEDQNSVSGLGRTGQLVIGRLGKRVQGRPESRRRRDRKSVV